MHVIAAGLLVVELVLGTPDRAPACDADRDSDGQVGVWEVLQLVGCTLEPSEDCGQTGIDDVVSAVHDALYGCALAPRWLSFVPCVQCEICPRLTIAQLIALANGQPITVDVPEGVRVLEWRSRSDQVTCHACGCPLVTVSALVPSADVERLIAVGWRD